MVEASVSAVLLDRHVPPGAADFLQVDLYQGHAGALPSAVTQDLTPGIHRQGVAVRRAFLVVPADLRRCQDEALRLYGPSTE